MSLSLPLSGLSGRLSEGRPAGGRPQGLAGRRTNSRDDSGFTLVELLIAIVLSGIIAGVTVAALVTALNVSSSTTAQIADSTDAGLISSYLIRDAESAGATSPTTALPVVGIGVSIDQTTVGWSGCAQVAPMVVRFSWIDRVSASTQPTVVVTYALDAQGQLTRRMCKNGTTVDVVLGRHLLSAVATCAPIAACTGTPTKVSLAVRGVGTRAPLVYTLTASLRNDVQAAPTTLNSTSVALLALGTPTVTAACPNLTLSGSGVVTVVGSVLVDSTCGSTPISGTQSLLKPTGTTSAIAGISDPFLGRQAPVATCVAGGVNPAIIGQSATADTVTMYPQLVTISAAQNFDPGRYVFCAGLSITTGTVTGTDVMLEVVGGTVVVNAAATLDLTAPTTGAYTNLLLWVTTAQAITIDAGTHANTLRGLVYAPTSTVQLSSTLGANVGGVIAKGITLKGQGVMRVGLPLPAVSIAPTSLAPAEVGLPYVVQVLATGGTMPYTWTASGLPAGLTINATTGLISGTPTAAGSFGIVVTAVDATSVADSTDYSITVFPKLTITSPSSLPDGQVAVAYSPTSMIATGGLAPTTWSASGLPAGLSINASTGTISGTPSAAGSFTVTASATDALLATDTKSYSVTIAAKAVVPATCPTSPVGWRGEYFANMTLTAPATVCRDDANIAFDWGEGAAATTLPIDQFSVRWTKVQTFTAGTYLFSVGSNDGSRLYIDGTLVFDRWVDQGYPNPVPTVSVALTGGSHTIVMEYYENSGGAGALLSWVATTPPSCSVAASGWLGEYFSNISLTGPPTACRDDANVNFDWAYGAPMTGLPTDNFSTRWTKTSTLPAGSYTLTLGTDDGGRLYIDGVLAIDRWVDQSYPASPPSVTKKLSEGAHTFVVEYYERGGAAKAVLTSSVVLDNGVRVVPSIAGDRKLYGENIITLTNPAEITSMSVTITVAKTTGLSYNGQYTDFSNGTTTLSNTTSASVIRYTFDLKTNKTIVAGTWTIDAQWNGTGSLHVSTGDTWTVTTTSAGITNTLSGTF